MAKTNSSREERKKRRAQRSKDAGGRSGDGKPQKGKLREWVDALVFAVVVMTIVRSLFFDLFRIPTPSMEKSLLVGDYLVVSKLHYGTRTPMTIGIPFTDIYIPGLTLPNTRFPGFSEVKRGDSVVFNWPADDSYKPIDRREHYIKRVVGLPGETVELQDKQVLVDGSAVPLSEGMQQTWDVIKSGPQFQLSGRNLRELGVTEVVQTSNPSVVRIAATEAAAEAIAQSPWVEEVRPAVAQANPRLSAVMFPGTKPFTPDNFGPLPIPAAGETVELTADNYAYFQTAITKYEGHSFEAISDSVFVIDGEPATSYTFSQDYFFVMGDNRDNSEDSRFWGYGPMDHMVGKAVVVYFSWDASRMLPRFSRIFSLIR